MNKYPIISNQNFQETVLAEVNTALGDGVTATQLADYLEYCIVAKLRELATKQMQAAMAEQAAEIKTVPKEEDAHD